MTKQSFILVYGRDLSLLKTRSWVVEGAGFRVRTTVDFVEMMSMFQAEPPALTILCHSLLPEQRKTALDATRAACPSRKALVLNDGMDALPQDEQTASLDSFDGPRVLVATVKSLLAKPGA